MNWLRAISLLRIVDVAVWRYDKARDSGAVAGTLTASACASTPIPLSRSTRRDAVVTSK